MRRDAAYITTAMKIRFRTGLGFERQGNYLRESRKGRIRDKGSGYMEERTYFISEVSKLVGVEPHVLRYWEEELELKIRRNSQGKRCYTWEDVSRFQEAKRWKDKGMQLKAVKEILEEGGTGQASAGYVKSQGKNLGECQEDRPEKYQNQCLEEHQEEYQNECREEHRKECQEESPKENREEEKEHWQEYEIVTLEEPSDSMKKFENLLDSLIVRALERNNEKLVREICDEILERLEFQIEEKARDAVEQELLQELLREGERESAAASQTGKKRESIWKRWKRKLEDYWG